MDHLNVHSLLRALKEYAPKDWLPRLKDYDEKVVLFRMGQQDIINKIEYLLEKQRE